MYKVRFFIFFYKCEDINSHMYGQYGTWSKTLPNNMYVSEQVSISNNEYKASEVNILSFNEVSEVDYNNFFNKTKVK